MAQPRVFFAEHLFNLKMKPFQTAGAKETVGTLLTPIFIRWGIPLDQAMVIDQRVYMDAVHLYEHHEHPVAQG